MADPAPGPTTRREFDIDWFRGLVCLSLIVLHFYHNGPLYSAIHSLIGSVGDFIIQHLRLGVESFFVLAGFMMAHMLRPVPGDNISVRGYLVRRFFRLIIPYWCAVLLGAADRWGVKLLFNPPHADVPSAGDIFMQMSLTQEFSKHAEDMAPTGYWSMVTLEQFYLLWIGCWWLSRKCFGARNGSYGNAERVMSWLTLAACLASATILITGVEPGIRLAKYAVYLTLGLMLYWAIRQGFARPQFVIGVLALATVAICTVPTGNSRPIAGLISVAILVPLCRGRRLPSIGIVRFLSWAGRRSYSLYLIHPVVGIRVLSLGNRFGPDPGTALLLGLVGAAFIATFIAGELFYRMIELPCQARARKVDYRGRRNAVAA